jgi:ABC-type bacteriocin/lantibiotic exporter with double-glycine peptidase domain
MIYAQDQLESSSAHTYTPKSAVAHVLSLLKAERFDIFLVILYALVIGILSLVVPIGVQSIVNTVAFGSLYQPVIVLTILVLVLLGLSGMFNLIQIWVVEILQRRLFVRVALDLARRIPRFQPSVLREEVPQDLINRFFEVVLVQKLLSKIILEGVAVVLQAAIGLIILSFYHPFLFVFVLLLGLAVVFICGVLGVGAIATSMKESSAKHTVLIWLENLADNSFLFKSGQGRTFAMERADYLTSSYLNCRMKHFQVLFHQMIGFAVLQTIASAALLSLGGYLVINEQLTLGQLVAAELIVSGVLLSFNKLGKLLESYYDLVASIAKLDSLIELPTEEFRGDPLVREEIPLSVTLKDVVAGFPGSRQPVLKGVNLEVPSGEKIAICGDNGSGKSLLADLLVRFHPHDDGTFKIGPQHIKDLNFLSLREQVKMVRGVEFFRGTIEDNLMLGLKGIMRSELREVLDSVGLREEIDALPDGLETWLREDARPLSSGQAHRFVLARALILKPRLLIIDEVLDHIDQKVMEQSVLPTLLRVDAPWTLLVMTHELSLAKRFNISYVLKDGKLSPLKS